LKVSKSYQALSVIKQAKRQKLWVEIHKIELIEGLPKY
jgi:hypothetical protein